MPNRRISYEEERRRRRAYRYAPSDAQAAMRLGLSLATFSTWRRSRGLPPRRRLALQQKRLKPALQSLARGEEARRRAAFETARTDREAAQALGMRWETVAQWRRDRGLPAKNRTGRRPTRSKASG
jgi:hypothetical protein